MRVPRVVVITFGICTLAALAWLSGGSFLLGTLFLPHQYVEACKAAEVRFIRAPAKPVQSVALDYLPREAASAKRRYEFSLLGKVETVGSVFWQPRVEQQIDLFEIRIPYVPEKPEWEFYRYQRQDTPTPANARSAEVLVLDTVSHSEELQNALWKQGLVEHHLKVTDLRNGEELAEMRYAVDLKNARACGRNAKGAIDVDLFILQAIAVPIVVPEYERTRRERAVIKNWE